ncbi:predicted protein [Postia placenta Mad-698-R]|nr:predicted protein [Postia placenta Mad-698-R]
MFEPVRGGTRGGQAEFKWSDVSQDKDRENYLGHSINAPTGRWQKNKDIHWYNRDLPQTQAERDEEIRKVKEAEAEALAAALGFATATKPGAPSAASGSGTGSNAIGVAPKPEAAPPAPDTEKEERRRRKEERRREKEEKRARKEKRRAERHRSHGDEDDGDDARHTHRHRSRSRSPRGVDRAHGRPERNRSPHAHNRSRTPPARRHTDDRAYGYSEREREQERDRRRWEDNARRERPGTRVGESLRWSFHPCIAVKPAVGVGPHPERMGPQRDLQPVGDVSFSLLARLVPRILDSAQYINCMRARGCKCAPHNLISILEETPFWLRADPPLAPAPLCRAFGLRVGVAALTMQSGRNMRKNSIGVPRPLVDAINPRTLCRNPGLDPVSKVFGCAADDARARRPDQRGRAHAVEGRSQTPWCRDSLHDAFQAGWSRHAVGRGSAQRAGLGRVGGGDDGGAERDVADSKRTGGGRAQWADGRIGAWIWAARRAGCAMGGRRRSSGRFGATVACGLPFFLEDKTGELTGSEYLDVHDRARFAYRCTLRDTHHTAYMVYEVSPAARSTPVASLNFGGGNALGTVKIGQGQDISMSKYLSKVGTFGSTTRKFTASDGQEYQWTRDTDDGSDAEWTCLNAKGYHVASYSLKLNGEQYETSSGCMLTVEESYESLIGGLRICAYQSPSAPPTMPPTFALAPRGALVAERTPIEDPARPWATCF